MSSDEKKFFRVNRFILVALVIIGCSSGVVALVSSPEILTKPPSRLSFPEPLKKVQGYKTPTKTLAINQEISIKDPVEVTVEEKTDENVQDPINNHIIMAVVFAVKNTDSLKFCHFKVL